MTDARDVPSEINMALCAFDDALREWLKRGGERRLAEFEPLAAWQAVCGLMAGQGTASTDDVARKQAELQRLIQ